MPLAKGSKNITIRVGLMPRLINKHQEEIRSKPHKTDRKLIGFVNDLLSDVLDKDEFLKHFAPYLSIIDIVDNILYIKDSKIKHSIEIYLKNGSLYCDYDKNFSCRHIHYAFAIPEIARLDLKRMSK